MPKMLADGGTEYDDGTEATEAQQAKVHSCVMCNITMNFLVYSCLLYSCINLLHALLFVLTYGK